jgi:hypothetical protein
MIKRALLLALLAIGAGTVVGCIRVHADPPAGVNAVIEPQFITRCPCAGEFRDQPRRGTKSLAQQAMRGEV